MSSSRSARMDLLATVQAHEETIAKYEKRLKDVVTAYKGLAKEKEALEASFKAITADPAKQGDDEGGPDRGQAHAEAAGSEQADDNLSEAGSAASMDQRKLRDKVQTLTKTVMTLTTEKSRLEATFQEDRKKLISARKERDAQVAQLEANFETLKSHSQIELEELKSKLIVERHGREKDASDNQVMLRELQKVIADERRAKEKVETQLQEAHSKIRSLEISQNRNDSSLESKVSSLEIRLKQKTEEFDRLQAKLKAPSPEAERLRRQVQGMKEDHRRDLERAEMKAEEAERRANSTRLEQEQRVTSLETRLEELSETVGTYDRLRTHDQAEIQKLKDRITQLGEENASLSRAGSLSPEQPVASGSKSAPQDNVPQLMDQYTGIKQKLILANNSSSSPIDLDDFFSDDDVNLKLRRQLDALQREFDTYKRRYPQSGTGASSPAKYLLPEVDQEVVHSLKAQLVGLEDKNRMLAQKHGHLQTELNEAKRKEAELVREMEVLKAENDKKREAAEAEFKAKINSVETEFQKQRDRCITLIEEKEDEVSMLKANMEMAFETAFSQPDTKTQLQIAAKNLARSMSAGSGARARSRKSSHVSGPDESLLDDVAEGLKSANLNEGMVLHYEQEISLKEVEIRELRKKVFELESAMRELQMSFVTKEEKFADKLDLAEQQIARLKRKLLSEGSESGANLEYLKNVVFNYMTSSDANSRDHMLKAIGAVLVFSGSEVKQVRDYNKAWWKPVVKK